MFIGKLLLNNIKIQVQKGCIHAENHVFIIINIKNKSKS